jgi:hypothetical protein
MIYKWTLKLQHNTPQPHPRKNLGEVLSLVGALALACSDMKICEEYQLQFFIANTWLLVSFIFDFVQSFTLLNLSPTLRIFRMYKIVILIYIIILFSSFLF